VKKKVHYRTCKFCGSKDITDVRISYHKTKTKKFEPKLGIEKISASLGSLQSKKDSEYTMISKYCKTCLNIHVSESSTQSKPIELFSYSTSKKIVIPYTLAGHLKSVSYQTSDLQKLAYNLSKKLDKMYKGWLKKGLNPCKCNRMGYKIKLKLKQGTVIMCWVIIDMIENKVVYRLSYGGGNVTCP